MFFAFLSITLANQLEQSPKRNLGTAITSLSDWVACVSDSGSKYCRSKYSTYATGYCWGSSEVTTNWGLGTNIICTDDSVLFPNNTKYTFCPMAETASYCGVNGVEEINIDNGKQTIINSYRIDGTEVCYYMINIYDDQADYFKVTVLSATNANVSISQYYDTIFQHKNEVQLSVGSTHTQTWSYEDKYTILVLPLTAGTSSVLISIDSKVTNPKDTMSTQDIVVLCVVISVLSVLLIASIVLVCKVACGDHYTPPPHRVKYQKEYDELWRTETNRFNKEPQPKQNARSANYIEKSDSSLDYKRNKTGKRR